MKTVQEIAREIVAREGGFVNDPDDPGGATKYGVTLGTMKRLRIDKTGDGMVDVRDVLALTADDAVRIFAEEYFQRPGIDRLPEQLQASVFDMYVNAGAGAIRILQRLLNTSGHGLQEDGALGPKTVAAAFAVGEKSGMPMLVNAYGIARREYYYALADRRAASRKYAHTRDGGKGGWIRRAEEFIAPEYHLSDAAHRARTARWG